VLGLLCRESAVDRAVYRLIAGPEELHGWLEQLARGESFMVREEAERALA
jgi:hypothetical protein